MRVSHWKAMASFVSEIAEAHIIQNTKKQLIIILRPIIPVYRTSGALVNIT